MNKQKRSIRSRILSIILALCMVVPGLLSSLTVQAATETTNVASEEGFIFSIEDYSTGQGRYILEPIRVETGYDGTKAQDTHVMLNKALAAAGIEGITAEKGPQLDYWIEYISRIGELETNTQNFDFDSGDFLTNTRWEVAFNSVFGTEVFVGKDFKYDEAHKNSVIRAMYTANNGEDIGATDRGSHVLNVNKDELVRTIADARALGREDLATAIAEAEAVALQTDADQETVNAKAAELVELMTSEPSPEIPEGDTDQIVPEATPGEGFIFSIEDYSTGEGRYILEPVRVETGYDGTKSQDTHVILNRALTAAGIEGITAEKGPQLDYWIEYIDRIGELTTDTSNFDGNSGDLLTNTRWEVAFNNVFGTEIFVGRDFKYDTAHKNSVIRAMYTADNGTDIGATDRSSHQMSVNKDELLRTIADVRALNRADLKEAVKTAEAAALSKNLSAEDVEAAITALNEAVKGPELGDPEVFFQSFDSEEATKITDGTLNLNPDIVDSSILAGTFTVSNIPASSRLTWHTEGEAIRINESTGELYVYDVGETVVTATEYKSNGETREVARVTVKSIRKEVEDMKLFVDGKDVTNGKLTVQGSEQKAIDIKVKYKGEDNYTAIVSHAASHKPQSKDKVWNIENAKYFYFMQPGTDTMTVALYSNPDITATVEITSEYVPVESVKPAISGVNKVHARNSMSVTGDDFTAIETTIIIMPENASFKNQYVVESSNKEIGIYSDSLPKAYIPFSKGDVTFTAKLTDKDPSTGKTRIVEGSSDVTFEYLNPLTKVTSKEPEVKVVAGNSARLPLSYEGTLTDGHSISEPALNWTYDTEGIVNVYRNSPLVQVRNESVAVPDNGDFVGNGEYFVEGIKPGTVTITGTPVDDTNKVEPVTIKITVGDPDEGKPDVPALTKQGIDTAIQAIRAKHEGTGYVYNDEWDVYGLIRAGETLTEEEKAGYYASIAETVKSWKPSVKPTEIERVSLALSILGYDITDIDGVNLAAMIYNHEKLDMGSNELIFALIALDAADIRIPSDAKWTRNTILDALYTYQNEDGGLSLFAGSPSDLDITAMALQALRPYQNLPEAVEVSEKAITFIKEKIAKGFDAGFCESNAQILLALTALGKNPLSEPGFYDDYRNLVASIMKYHVPGEGFAHSKGGSSNSMATVQALQGLTAYDRFAKGETTYWDLQPAQPDPFPDLDFPYDGFTTISIEGFTLGKEDYIGGPVRVPYSMQKTNTPKKATDFIFGVDTVKEGSYTDFDAGIYFGYQIKGIKDLSSLGEYIMNEAYGPDSRWFMSINGKIIHDPVSHEFSALHKGDVIRFMYSMDGGKDLGIVDKQLTVNKDALLRRLAEITPEQLEPQEESNPKFAVYTEAVRVAKDLKATQTQTDEILMKLNKAMAGLEVEVNPVEPEKPEKPEKPGWTQNGNIWGYVKEDGTPAKAEFLKIGVNTFYFDENGVMATGWKEIEGTWYYFYDSGRMLTGWQKIGTNWFYFEADGAMVTGWKAIGTKWYYFYDSGRMLTGWQKIDGYWYYLKSSGEMTKGWLNDGGKWFYFDGSGHMATGWKAVGTKWYYFFDSGRMATGWLQEGGHWYYLKSSGEMTKGWLKDGRNWFYFNGSGHMLTGKQKIDGKWYTFRASGAMER